MVHLKPLFLALAAVSTVVARPPCRPDTTAPTLSTTTTAAEETTSTETSATETSAAETSTTAVSTTTTADDETSTTAAPTTTTTEAGVSTTSTAPETTTSAPAPVCGITGYFVPGHALTYLYSPGYKPSAKECLEGCATYSGCEVIAFYYTGSDFGRCEYFKGPLITDGQYTDYKWYDVGCLANM